MTIDVTIEKLIYGGDGLARSGEGTGRRGKSVFIPFVLEGEDVRAMVIEEKRGFIRARSEEVLKRSPERIVAKCPYFLRCGGCHYQHTGYENQLRIKESILRETLRRGAKLDWQNEITVHPSPPWNYRNRTRLKLRTSPFAFGYFRFGSHELLPIEECPISSPLINQAITVIWELGGAAAVPQEISEIEFFVDAEDSALLIECYCASAVTSSAAIWNAFWSALKDGLPQTRGMAGFTGSTAAPMLTKIFGEDHLQYVTPVGTYRVSAGAFFQVNRFMIGELMTAALPSEGGARALDLYSGGGLFSAQLAKIFSHVTAVESSSSSYNDLATNSPQNVELRRVTTEMFLAEHFEDTGCDFILADPPRLGLSERVARQLAQLAAPRITYVSCDPATLARDLAVLLAAGYKLRELHLVDLFPQTYHLETVAHLAP